MDGDMLAMFTRSKLRGCFRVKSRGRTSHGVYFNSKRPDRGRYQNEFTAGTRRDLADRVRNQCGFPGCSTVTVGPKKGSTGAAKSGWAAHIHGAAPGSARYRKSMTPKQRRSPNNGIHMCAHHGILVDSDARTYPAQLLRHWKRDAEARARREHELGIKPPQPSSAPKPHIICVKTPTTRLNDKPGGTYQFTVSQIWFENRPTPDRVIATALAGYVSVFHGKTRLFENLRCEWVIANAHENVGFDETIETWSELQPNGNRAKLFVIHKRTDEDDAYIWTRGALEYKERGHRHPSRRLPKGDYRLVVRILGTNVDQTFRFKLHNPGAGTEQSLDPIRSGSR